MGFSSTNQHNQPLLLAAGGDSGPRDLESAARFALDVRAGRTLTDREWAHARAILLDLAILLRWWGQNVGANESETPVPRAA